MGAMGRPENIENFIENGHYSILSRPNQRACLTRFSPVCLRAMAVYTISRTAPGPRLGFEEQFPSAHMTTATVPCPPSFRYIAPFQYPEIEYVTLWFMPN